VKRDNQSPITNPKEVMQMESDLSGLRDESDLELMGQTGQIAGGFPLLRDVPQAGDRYEDTKTRGTAVPLCL
jgi:hypothetical protein